MLAKLEDIYGFSNSFSNVVTVTFPTMVNGGSDVDNPVTLRLVEIDGTQTIHASNLSNLCAVGFEGTLHLNLSNAYFSEYAEIRSNENTSFSNHVFSGIEDWDHDTNIQLFAKLEDIYGFSNSYSNVGRLN